MTNWYSLDLIPIDRAVKEHPDLDIKALMRSICDGHTKLYLLVPSDCVVVKYPESEAGIEVPELTDLFESRAPGPMITKIWTSPIHPDHESTAVQIKPEKAALIANEVLFSLARAKYEEIDCPNINLFDKDFLHLTGFPALVAELPYDTGHMLSLLKERNPDLAKKYPSLTQEVTFLRSACFHADFNDLATTKDSLFTLRSPVKEQAYQERSMKKASDIALDHPAKDPDHPGYASELHAALAIWEDFYLQLDQPTKQEHTRKALKWLDDNWEETLSERQRTRIANVSNRKDNKNAGLEKEN